jgi:hypothetical protein
MPRWSPWDPTQLTIAIRPMLGYAPVGAKIEIGFGPRLWLVNSIFGGVVWPEVCCLYARLANLGPYTPYHSNSAYVGLRSCRGKNCDWFWGQIVVGQLQCLVVWCGLGCVGCSVMQCCCCCCCCWVLWVLGSGWCPPRLAGHLGTLHTLLGHRSVEHLMLLRGWTVVGLQLHFWQCGVAWGVLAAVWCTDAAAAECSGAWWLR